MVLFTIRFLLITVLLEHRPQNEMLIKAVTTQFSLALPFVMEGVLGQNVGDVFCVFGFESELKRLWFLLRSNQPKSFSSERVRTINISFSSALRNRALPCGLLYLSSAELNAFAALSH